MEDRGDGVFASGGANNDKVGADAADFTAHKRRNAAGERKNKDNTGDTNGNTKTSEERTSAILLDGIFGEAKMIAK